MNVTFYGAVRTVTGSMHLVETGGVRILLDCGLYQGRRADFYEVNSRFPFSPASIDAVVLSHAHLDHCGNLPTLVRQGFDGRIYCTPATRDLTALILRDSAKVQAQNTKTVNKIRARQGRPPVQPLYTAGEAEEAVHHLSSVGYHHAFSVGSTRITFYDAGHILGSAVTVLQADGKVLGFTGDLGRPGAPILRDPESVPGLDALISESTYGDRRHDDREATERTFGEIVARTVAERGKVLIPSFAVGRTQDVVYTLHRLQEARRVPGVSIFVDSPMAVDATEIFRLHQECFDEETRARFDQRDPFGFRRADYLRSVEDSKRLNEMPDPFVVVATSGMCESGRILYHLQQHLGDDRSSLILVSFQAEHTLGRRLADGVSPVNVFGEPHQVRLHVHTLEAFSSHADQRELVHWITKVPRVGHVYCVHGEATQSYALAGQLASRGLAATVPERGQQITV